MRLYGSMRIEPRELILWFLMFKFESHAFFREIAHD